jgi:hypothetical protein
MVRQEQEWEYKYYYRDGILPTTKCHSGCSEHLDVALGGRLEGVKTLLGRSERGRFVKAPEQPVNNFMFA